MQTKSNLSAHTMQVGEQRAQNSAAAGADASDAAPGLDAGSCEEMADVEGLAPSSQTQGQAADVMQPSQTEREFPGCCVMMGSLC